MNTDHNSGPRHETRDASIRGLVTFGIGLFLTLLVVLVLMAKLFHFFATEQSLGPPPSTFANVRTLPPGPRLQAAPREDIRAYRAREEQLLNSYGWVDKKAGIVKIPIDRAMDLVLERGLPVRGNAPTMRASK